MGTRSTIALEFTDGTVQQIYCHWDGYLDNNGAILAEHYQDPFVLRDLIALGDFSSLCESVDSTAQGAYSKRGEDCVARKYDTILDYYADCQQEEYDYVLRQIEGKAVWFVRCDATDDRWVTLANAVELQALQKDMA